MTDISKLNPPKDLLRMLGSEGSLLGGKGNSTGGRKKSPLSKNQVSHVQGLMVKGVGTSGLSYGVEIDGAWGPQTIKAWRDLCGKAVKTSCESYPDLKEVNEVLSLHGVT
jgi:hypothetical protein